MRLQCVVKSESAVPAQMYHPAVDRTTAAWFGFPWLARASTGNNFLAGRAVPWWLAGISVVLAHHGYAA